MIKTSSKEESKKEYSKKVNTNHTQQQQQSRQSNNINISPMNEVLSPNKISEEYLNNNNNNYNINSKYTINTTNPQFTETQFMKYYEENIRIRKELEEKNNYINELRSKLEAQMSLDKTVNPYLELKNLKNELKKEQLSNNVRPNSAYKGNKNNNKTFYNTTTSTGESRKLENLLEIIESYKQKLMISEEECANLRQQKLLLEQDVKLNNNNSRYGGTNRNNNNNNILLSKEREQQQELEYQNTIQSKYDELINKLRQKSSELELEKERNKYVEAELRRLETKQRTLEMDSDTIEELKVENRILEERIMKLTLISDNNNGNGENDYRSLEEKNKELEHKLKSGLEKYNKLKEEKTKIEIDYKLLQNKLIEIQHELQELNEENIKLKKNEVNDPIIQRLIKDKLLLAQVIGEIEEGERYNNNNSNREKQQSMRNNKEHTSFESTHKLLLEKEALAKELIEVKNRIKLLEETWREKETMIKIEKEELMAQLKSNVTEQQQNNNNNKYINTKSYTSKQGIQYDGDITMFSDERTPLTSNVNYFDIYLGRVNLIETLVKSVTPLNTSSPLLMATVDFYNFPTENTKLSQGLVADLDTEFVFKISEEEFFYKFLTKGNVKISIWATEGNKNYLIGNVDVVLKQLVMKNRPNVSPVINTSAPIINGQKVVGTIFFDMRMRLPIYEQSSKLLSQPMSSLNEELSKELQHLQQRKLIIQIDEGSGFKESSKLFVYYQFRLEDYYTRTSPGPVPKWAHYKMIDLRYDEEMKNYLKKNEFEMAVFDDSVVMDEKDSDIVGMGVVSLVGLVENKMVREKIMIRKNGVVTGNIEVKLFWYESSTMSSKEKQQQQLSSNTEKSKQQLLESLHNDILEHIHLTNSAAEREFKKIDSNSTGMISFDEFNMWVIRIKQSQRYSRDLISMYYDGFQQPLNLLNWIAKLSERHEEIIKHNSQTTELMPELSKINQLLKKNSVQIDTKVSLREYLKDKNMFNVTLDIDTNGNGEISREELIAYMNRHNVVVDEGEIEGDSVNLVSFLKKYGK